LFFNSRQVTAARAKWRHLALRGKEQPAKQLSSMTDLIPALLPYLVAAATALWVGVLLAPWRPWSTRERLASSEAAPDSDLSDVTVLIPARNEAAVIAHALQAVQQQGQGLKIVLVDDQSRDDTAEVARHAAQVDLEIVVGQALPAGWSGKLWALEQARSRVTTEFILLLDADIELLPGILSVARAKLHTQGLDLVSLMAAPRMESLWEKLLMPAFVYYFKLLYPFRLSNTPRSRVAAAAGGFVLIRTQMLERIGGFASLRDALIDDCALARRVKTVGGATWLGLSLDVRSQRANAGIGEIWRMVARTAFTQLRYSGVWLGVCTLTMVIAFWGPIMGLQNPSSATVMLAAAGLIIMMLTYLPTLKFYGRSPVWALAMPLIGTLYLAMVWSSACGYWRGRGACWKDRVYRGQPT
jgi:hopene-associated glycosyltransferase HpnB